MSNGQTTGDPSVREGTIQNIYLSQANIAGKDGVFWDLHQVIFQDFQGFTYTKAGISPVKKNGDFCKYKATPQGDGRFKINFINDYADKKPWSKGFSGTPPEVSALAQANILFGSMHDNMKAQYGIEQATTIVLNTAKEFLKFLKPTDVSQQQQAAPAPQQQQGFPLPQQVNMPPPQQQQPQPQYQQPAGTYPQAPAPQQYPQPQGPQPPQQHPGTIQGTPFG